LPTYQAYLHTYQRQRTGTLSAYLTHFATAYLTSQLTSHPYQLTNLPTYQLTNLPTYQLTRYSEFVAFPIELWSEKTTYETVPLHMTHGMHMSCHV